MLESAPLDTVDLQRVESLTTLDARAGEDLDSFVGRKYAELRELAHRLCRQEASATSIVHTAYRRLAQKDPRVEGEAQGFALFSRAIRHALVDRARARDAQKRGGGGIRVSFDPGRDDPADPRRRFELAALHEALEQLRDLDERKWEIVEHKWFGGLTDEESARTIGVSVATIERDWKFAKAWLRRRLGTD